MLCNIGLISSIHLHELAIDVHICAVTLDPPSHLPPFSVPLGCYRAPESHRKLPLAIRFTYGGVYACMLLSIHFTLSFLHPPRPVSIRLFSTSASPLLLCKQILQYCLSRFLLYELIYRTCLSLSDLLHSITSLRFIHIIRTDTNVVRF